MKRAFTPWASIACIERAGVAKASLYSTFGSKDELVRAYLLARHERRQAAHQCAHRAPRQPARRDPGDLRLLGELAARAELSRVRVRRRQRRGSARRNQGDRRSVPRSRGWTRGLFTELRARRASAIRTMLGRQLVLLYDGAMVGAAMEGGAGRRRDGARDGRGAAGHVRRTQ